MVAASGRARRCGRSDLPRAHVSGRGRCYRRLRRGSRWFRLAAEVGDADAQGLLAGLYFLGRGVPEDLVLAYMWANLGSAQGDEAAQQIRELTEQYLTREQIAEAQRLSREWIETHPQDGGN